MVRFYEFDSVTEAISHLADASEYKSSKFVVAAFFLTVLITSPILAISESIYPESFPMPLWWIIVGILSWKIYSLQEGLLHGKQSLNGGFAGLIYLSAAITSIPLAYWAVTATVADDKGVMVVATSFVLFPAFFMGAAFGLHFWLRYLQSLHYVSSNVVKSLNQQSDLLERCLEAKEIYRRIGPEHISGYRTSYTIDHSKKFSSENIEIIRQGVTKQTLLRVAPMIHATLRLKEPNP